MEQESDLGLFCRCGRTMDHGPPVAPPSPAGHPPRGEVRA